MRPLFCCGGNGCCPEGKCCGGNDCCTDIVDENGVTYQQECCGGKCCGFGTTECCGGTDCCDLDGPTPCCVNGTCEPLCPGEDYCPDASLLSCNGGCGCGIGNDGFPEKCCAGNCCEGAVAGGCCPSNLPSGCPCGQNRVCCPGAGCCDVGELCCNGACVSEGDWLECCTDFGGNECTFGDVTLCCNIDLDGDGDIDIPPTCCDDEFGGPICCDNCCELKCGGHICQRALETSCDGDCDADGCDDSELCSLIACCGNTGYCDHCWLDSDNWDGSQSWTGGCECGCQSEETQGTRRDGINFCCAEDTSPCGDICCGDDERCCTFANPDGTFVDGCCPQSDGPECCCWSTDSNGFGFQPECCNEATEGCCNESCYQRLKDWDNDGDLELSPCNNECSNYNPDICDFACGDLDDIENSICCPDDGQHYCCEGDGTTPSCYSREEFPDGECCAGYCCSDDCCGGFECEYTHCEYGCCGDYNSDGSAICKDANGDCPCPCDEPCGEPGSCAPSCPNGAEGCCDNFGSGWICDSCDECFSQGPDYGYVLIDCEPQCYRADLTPKPCLTNQVDCHPECGCTPPEDGAECCRKQFSLVDDGDNGCLEQAKCDLPEGGQGGVCCSFSPAWCGKISPYLLMPCVVNGRCATPCSDGTCPTTDTCAYYHGGPCPCEDDGASFGACSGLSDGNLKSGGDTTPPPRINPLNNTVTGQDRNPYAKAAVKGFETVQDVPLARPLRARETTIKTQFQILNFVADEGLKTEVRTEIESRFSTQLTAGTFTPKFASSSNYSESKSRVSVSEKKRGSKKLGEAGAQVEGIDAETIKGTITTTTLSDGTLGKTIQISFVSGSNIRLDTNEAGNIIRISVDDLNVNELLDVSYKNLANGNTLRRGAGDTWGKSTYFPEGPTGATGSAPTSITGGVEHGVIVNIDGVATVDAGLKFDGVNTFDVGAASRPAHFNSGISAGAESNFNDNEFQAAQFLDTAEGASGSYLFTPGTPLNVAVVNFNDGPVQYVTATAGGAGATAILPLLNTAATGEVKSVTLIITNGGLFSQSDLVANQKWAGGSQPTLSNSGIDIISIMNVNDGSDFGFNYCFQNGTGMA